MIPDEIDVPHAVVRVLEEAGIQFVFGMPGGDTGRIFDALHDSTEIQTILVRHEQVGSIMAEMFGRPTGRPGPVAVVFGSRSLGGPVKTRRPPRVHATARHLAHGAARPAATDVARVADLLLGSSSPVILAGNGVHSARAWAELGELADLLAIPVATTATGKSALAEVHPQALGVFGNWGQAVANEVVSTADTVLVVGSRLAPTDTAFENPELLDADRQAFLQIDVEPLNVGRHFPVAAAVVADARESLAALATEID